MTHLLSTISKRAMVFCCSLAILLTSFALHTPALVHADSGNANEAGYKAVGNRGEFTAADVSFTVPQLNSSSSNASVFMGIELGAGGNTSPQQAVRAGVISSWDSSTQTQTNEAMWAVWGTTSGEGSIDQPQILNINAGNRIWVYVGSNATGPYDGFQINDTSTGQTATHYEYSSNEYSDSASARCDVEPFSFGNAYPVAGFNFVTFVGCQVQDNGTMQSIGNTSYTKLEISNNGSTAVQTSDLRGGTDFDVTSN